MSYNEFLTIPQDARSSLIRYQDIIHQKHDVTIYFSTDSVCGDRQDIIIQGTPIGVFNAKKNIERLLREWRAKFDAFREQQARRKARRTGTNVTFPSIIVRKQLVCRKKAHTGVFDAHDSDIESQFLNGTIL